MYETKLQILHAHSLGHSLNVTPHVKCNLGHALAEPMHAHWGMWHCLPCIRHSFSSQFFSSIYPQLHQLYTPNLMLPIFLFLSLFQSLPTTTTIVNTNYAIMFERNIVVATHYNCSIFTYPNVGFSFYNTDTVVFKPHYNFDFVHLKSRIEKIATI